MFEQRQHETKFLFLLRWIARISSAVSIGLIFLFAFGGNWQFWQFRWEELGAILLFPLGLGSGLILAWQEELKGGVLAVCSVAAFYLVYGMALTGFNTQGRWLALFAIPGILFFAYGLLSRRAIAGSTYSNSQDLTGTTR